MVPLWRHLHVAQYAFQGTQLLHARQQFVSVLAAGTPLQEHSGLILPSMSPASFSQPAVWYGQVQLDYSSLSREHKAVKEGKERDKLAVQFQADIDERSALLAKLAPNLKAVEQYEAVKVSLSAQLAHTGRPYAASGVSTAVCSVTCQAVPCHVLSMAEVACCRFCSNVTPSAKCRLSCCRSSHACCAQRVWIFMTLSQVMAMSALPPYWVYHLQLMFASTARGRASSTIMFRLDAMRDLLSRFMRWKQDMSSLLQQHRKPSTQHCCCTGT